MRNSFGRFYIAVPLGFCYLERKNYCKFNQMYFAVCIFPQFFCTKKQKQKKNLNLSICIMNAPSVQCDALKYCLQRQLNRSWNRADILDDGFYLWQVHLLVISSGAERHLTVQEEQWYIELWSVGETEAFFVHLGVRDGEIASLRVIENRVILGTYVLYDNVVRWHERIGVWRYEAGLDHEPKVRIGFCGWNLHRKVTCLC